jgi:hypothetical protein
MPAFLREDAAVFCEDPSGRAYGPKDDCPAGDSVITKARYEEIRASRR